MKEKKEKNVIFKEKEWYKKEIVNKVSKIEDVWILKQIYRCILNIGK